MAVPYAKDVPYVPSAPCRCTPFNAHESARLALTCTGGPQGIAAHTELGQQHTEACSWLHARDKGNIALQKIAVGGMHTGHHSAGIRSSSSTITMHG